MKKLLTRLVAAMVLLALINVLPACGREGGKLRIATTTSLYDTGLWGYLEPLFEDEYGAGLDVLRAGTGKALEWGRRGDVDVIVVHSKTREEQFVAEGHGLERVPFAYNHFLIVGPESDPAGIRGMNPEDAFTRLMAEGKANAGRVKFVSRGDNSGTHTKERAIWTGAGYDYEEVRTSGAWYVEAGIGMGPALTMASEMLAYTLSDIGTYLTYKLDLDLDPLVDEGDMLLNVYSVIVVASTKNMDMANNLVEFFTSDRIQELIGNYGLEQYGRQVFTPGAGQSL
ncbi:MAG: substrate-binding domain-containing protein [Dehalococcoidia bacterium]